MKKRLSGIYRILNKVNGKGYVGSSKILNKRKSSHLWGLRHNKHKNPHLQAAWNQYGEENFIWEILEYCLPDNEILHIREQYWMDYYNVCNPEKGYNVEPDAIRRTHSIETRQKIGDGNRGKLVSLETRKKQSEALLGPKHKYFGKKLPKEWHNNIVKSSIGRIMSEETREKLRLANTGKKHGRQPQTIEFKRKILEFCTKRGFRPSKWSTDVEEKNLGNHLKHYIDKNSDQFDEDFYTEVYKFSAWQQFKKLHKEQ
jgi:group I intron endonuclease